MIIVGLCLPSLLQGQSAVEVELNIWPSSAMKEGILQFSYMLLISPSRCLGHEKGLHENEIEGGVCGQIYGHI